MRPPAHREHSRCGVRALQVRAILSEILRSAKAAVGSDRAFVFVSESGAAELTPLIADRLRITQKLLIDCGLAGLCGRTKEVIAENNCSGNPDFNPRIDRDSGDRTKSIIAIAIIGKVVAVIGVELLKECARPFTLADVETVNVFAALAEVSIRKSPVKTARRCPS
jgi:phosphoserine phosphatase